MSVSAAELTASAFIALRFIAVSITQHGYLDDSVSVGRYFAEVRRDAGCQMKLEGLWSQNMRARGEHAGQRTGTPCP